jgi:hypothetical protein
MPLTFSAEPVDIFAKEICKIGRDSESKYRVHGWLLAKPQLTISSNFVLSGDEEGLVSRNHCEIYAVKYDSGIHHIYARDRGSCNGTYVNKISIASDSGISSGYLLQDGDEIQVLPYWKFTLHQPDSPPERELTQLQTEEVKVCKKPDFANCGLTDLAFPGQVHLDQSLSRIRCRSDCVPRDRHDFQETAGVQVGKPGQCQRQEYGGRNSAS